jgi:organic hydroperoxide reductase OsmC/OhrA
MSYDVEVRNIAGQVTAIGASGPFTLVVDRPVEGGGGGRGFNGGQLLNLAVAGCISNDLFREAAAMSIALGRVVVRVSSDYVGTPAVSTPISCRVEVSGDAPEERLRELVAHVDRIAEIPNSIRAGTVVTLTDVRIGPA